MSQDIKVTATRAGAPIAQHLPLQLDNMSAQEAAYHGGQAPYFRFAAYSLTSVALEQSDLLQDEANVDPKTGADVKYRVINIPEDFPDGHVELVLDRVFGKSNPTS